MKIEDAIAKVINDIDYALIEAEEIHNTDVADLSTVVSYINDIKHSVDVLISVYNERGEE